MTPSSLVERYSRHASAAILIPDTVVSIGPLRRRAPFGTNRVTAIHDQLRPHRRRRFRTLSFSEITTENYADQGRRALS